MDTHDVLDSIFEVLGTADTRLCCVGPPECQHKIGLAIFNEMILLSIDDQDFQIQVEKIAGE